jgi:hypothetical protein
VSQAPTSVRDADHAAGHVELLALLVDASSVDVRDADRIAETLERVADALRAHVEAERRRFEHLPPPARDLIERGHLRLRTRFDGLRASAAHAVDASWLRDEVLAFCHLFHRQARLENVVLEDAARHGARRHRSVVAGA